MSEADAARSTWRTKFENRLTVSPTYYPEDVGQGTTQWSSAIREEPDYTARPNKNLKFHVAPWLYADPSAMSDSERFAFDVNEANADWRRGDWNCKVGINSVAWGVTDIYNPLEVVSARRYFDPLNAEKRGVPSVIAGYESGSWRTEAIYVPIQLESMLPGENSRWLPRDITYNRASDYGTFRIGKKFSYSYMDRREIDDALKNNYGLKSEFHGSGYDLTVILHQGAPTTPSLNPTIDAVATGGEIIATHIALQPVYYLRRTAGLGYVLTLESAIIRFAYAYSDKVSNSPGLPGWGHSAVVALEKNFAFGEGTLTTLLQTTYGLHEEQADNSLTSLDRLFDRAWILGFRYMNPAGLSSSFATIYDGVTAGAFIQAKVEKKLTDSLGSSLGGDWMDGPQGSTLGTFRRNRRILGSLTYYY